jgi:hypothetical protein
MDRGQLAVMAEPAGESRCERHGLPVAVTVFVGIAEEWKKRNGLETVDSGRGSGRAVRVVINDLARTATRIYPTRPAASNRPVHPRRHSSASIPLLLKTFSVTRPAFPTVSARVQRVGRRSPLFLCFHSSVLLGYTLRRDQITLAVDLSGADRRGGTACFQRPGASRRGELDRGGGPAPAV